MNLERVHLRVVFSVANVLKISHNPCAAAVSDACSTVADTSNTFPYTAPVMLCPISVLKLFSLLLALARMSVIQLCLKMSSV